MTTLDRWRHDVADHLEAIARILRRDDDNEAGQPPLAGSEDPLTIAKRVHPPLGQAQEKVLGEVAKAHPGGISAGDVARAIGMEQPNAHLTLGSLVRHRLARKDETTHPQTYYLGSRILVEMGETGPTGKD